MNKFKSLTLFLLSFWVFMYSQNAMAQGGISNLSIDENRSDFMPNTCGSFDLFGEIDHHSGSFKAHSDEFMEQLQQVITNKNTSRANDDIYSIPVVFHIVYNNESEDIPDSVILNQLDILNECFRRQNADAIETRPEFLNLVGDSKIEFRLANIDPSGEASNGITRTLTPIEHFGGILPYAPGQNSEILQWVNDSLFANYFRISETSSGGKDAWDTERYLNVWIGDLRTFEPAFDNFEELIYFAIGTPPIDHQNWPIELIEQINSFEQGIILHYVNAGPNNPNIFPPPYDGFNGITTTGKMLVHEVGHYLGLRHIWGDGDCSLDDFIDDTPNSNAASAWNCNFSSNFCVDNIEDDDLHNMVENYMDYSSGNCQNSFTLGQIDLMRTVIEEYRPLSFEAIPNSIDGSSSFKQTVNCFPNPSKGSLFIDFEKIQEHTLISIKNSLGQNIFKQEFKTVDSVNLKINAPSGIYFLLVEFDSGERILQKLILDQN
ncbi:MAG: zinc-dependent metalloprotease [Bacteroidia bacterium]